MKRTFLLAAVTLVLTVAAGLALGHTKAKREGPAAAPAPVEEPAE